MNLKFKYKNKNKIFKEVKILVNFFHNLGIRKAFLSVIQKPEAIKINRSN